jgi:hypothetical protein
MRIARAVRLLPVLLWLLVWDGARPALGADPAQPGADPAQLAEAKRHFEQGVALYNEGNFGAALAEFEASHRAYPVAGVLYNIGLTQKALFRYVEAIDTLGRYLREASPPPRPERRAEVERIIEEMTALLADVRLAVEPAGAAVVIDGRAAGTAPLPPLRLPAGQHTIEVSAEGYRGARKEVLVSAGTALQVKIALQALPRLGLVRVESPWPKAVVSVDGRRVGAAPVDLSLPAGGHTLLVEGPGAQPYRSELVVAAGQRRTVQVTLERPPLRLHQRWWFWTLGVIAAGGVAAALAVPLSTQAPDPLVGTLAPGVGRVN